MNTTHLAPAAKMSHNDFLAALDLDGICDTPEDTEAELNRLASPVLTESPRAQEMAGIRAGALRARLRTY
jgi:hypothetical protein